jgi:hypothetical protein
MKERGFKTNRGRGRSVCQPVISMAIYRNRGRMVGINLVGDDKSRREREIFCSRSTHLINSARGAPSPLLIIRNNTLRGKAILARVTPNEI